MSPPESAMPRAGYVVDRVGIRVVIAMIRDPCARGAGAIETREKDEDLLDYGIELNGAMSEGAVISNRRSEAAE
jgi:hypothetical protein